jgi:hypothetical protein
MAVASDTPVVKPAETAPSQMPGQTRYPSNKTAARAMPEEGQTAVALPGGMAKASPAFAVQK